jgi:glucokinase
MRNMKKYHIGLDLGGTKFSGMVLNANGETIIFREVPVRKTWTPRQLRAMLDSFVNDLIARANIKPRWVKTMGIGIPGIMDEHGNIKKVINLPALERVKLYDFLPTTRTSVWNDAVCAAHAESTMGNLVNASNGVHLMLGTGVGSATMTRLNESGIFGQRSVTQISNIEMGHVAANIETALTGTLSKKPYELEAYCSRKFFIRNAKGGVDKLYDAVWRGDKQAKNLFIRYGANVGVLLANVDTLFRPDTIIIGGGMTAYLPAYREAMEKVFRAQRFLPGKPTPIKLSAFGPEVGALGAALYGLLK